MVVVAAAAVAVVELLLVACCPPPLLLKCTLLVTSSHSKSVLLYACWVFRLQPGSCDVISSERTSAQLQQVAGYRISIRQN